MMRSGRAHAATMLVVALVVVGSVPIAGRLLDGRLDHTVPAMLPSELPSSTTTTTTRAARPGVSIRVIPAVRDFRIVVDGEPRATDATGRVEVPEAAGVVEVAVLGYTATPALRRVTSTGWSDGSTASVRTIDADASSELDLFVEIEHRVTVDATELSVPVPRATFRSEHGEVTLTPDRPTWVAANQAVWQGSGFLSEPLTYRRDTQTFTATPEVLWVLRD